MAAPQPVVYVPPTQADALTLSRSACANLAVSTGDPQYADDTVVLGLAHFLRVCGDILAEQENSGPK
jgi:hypothetical protein